MNIDIQQSSCHISILPIRHTYPPGIFIIYSYYNGYCIVVALTQH